MENQKQDQEQLLDKVVCINRVAKVVKGGKRFSFAAVVVVGDGKGRVGQGLGKANEVPEAIRKATENAKKNMVNVPIKEGTVPHSITGKFCGGMVFLKPAMLGTGIIAGGPVRAVCEAAGYKNILTKSYGSTNAHNAVKATIVALTSMKDPVKYATSRGKALQDIL